MISSMSVAEAVSAEEALALTLDEFAGRWVAILEHEVVADAATLPQLLSESVVEEQDVEIFRVADDPHAICCF
jgi:hypothetical protein